jgi:hypothetical protein
MSSGVVVTRPLTQNGLGFSALEAFEALQLFLDLFPLLRDERGVFEPWLILVASTPCLGKEAHDARLVSAMQRHGLTHILTFNTGDFARFRASQSWRHTQLRVPKYCVATYRGRWSAPNLTL